MSLREEERRVLVTLELEKSDKTLAEMEVQLQNGLWGLAANRLYYALFHAVSALLIRDRHEVGTHRGAVNKFSLFYVKTGLFSVAEGTGKIFPHSLSRCIQSDTLQRAVRHAASPFAGTAACLTAYIIYYVNH